MPDHPIDLTREIFDAAVVVVTMMTVLGYVWAAKAGRGRAWPRHRMLLWAAGLVMAASAVIGPLASAAHHSFPAHMVAHLLIGMLAPLLLVLGAPMTVLLRVVTARTGRALTRMLRSLPLRVLTDPVAAAVLNVGSLWALYTTDAYALMHTNPVLHVVVHLHMLVVGYLFTGTIIQTDPMPHRRSHGYRVAVLVLALAGHDILAKYVYAHPPIGVDPAASQTAAMIMYYGGDAVDLALLVLLGASWYTAARPGRARRPISPAPPMGSVLSPQPPRSATTRGASSPIAGV